MDNKKDNASIVNRLSQPITSLSFDKDELRKMCNLLQERAGAAAKIEVDNFLGSKGDSDLFLDTLHCFR